KIIYGKTGLVNKDGILSQDQETLLENIQENAANKSLEYLYKRTRDDLSPLIAMATGIGKGRIAHKIIEKFIKNNPNSKILYIAGTKNILVDQTHSALNRYIEAE